MRIKVLAVNNSSTASHVTSTDPLSNTGIVLLRRLPHSNIGGLLLLPFHRSHIAFATNIADVAIFL